MGISLPLEKMSIEDKIRTMETIWDNLCQTAESIPSPSWHKDILDEREKAIDNGKEEFKGDAFYDALTHHLELKFKKEF